MKKIFLLLVVFFLASQVNSQEAKLGITAGFLNLQASSTFQGSQNSVNGSGFYTGIFGDFPLYKAFHIVPAAIVGISKEANVLFIPILAKYHIPGTKFNVVAGPQGSILLGELDPLVKRLGWDFSLGAGYDITENIFLQARYALEITNRENKDILGAETNVKSRMNSLFIGGGYKF